LGQIPDGLRANSSIPITRSTIKLFGFLDAISRAALCAAATVRNWVPLTEIALTYFTTGPDFATARPTCRRPAPGAGGFDSGADQRRPTGSLT